MAAGITTPRVAIELINSGTSDVSKYDPGQKVSCFFVDGPDVKEFDEQRYIHERLKESKSRVGRPSF